MASVTTLNEGLRSPIDGTEYIRLATVGNNWKAQLNSQNWVFASITVNGTTLQPFDVSTPDLQVLGTDTGSASIGLAEYSNDSTNIAGIGIVKSRGATIGSQGRVSSGDQMGRILFEGSDGTSFQQGALVSAVVDTTPSSNSMPGRLVFSTTPSASTTAVERMRIDSAGRVIVGGVASQTGDGVAYQAQIHGTAATAFPGLNLGRWSADGSGPIVLISKSRNTTVGSQTILNSGDQIGVIGWAGSDGVAIQDAAYIQGTVDTTPSSNSMPGRLTFTTTPSGSVTPIERLRIDKDGSVFINSSVQSTQNSVIANGLTMSVDGSFTQFEINNYGTGNYAYIVWHKSRGTAAAKTVPQQFDLTGSYFHKAWDGSIWRDTSSIQHLMANTATSNNTSGYIIFNTTPSTTGGVTTERMRIDHTGGVFFPTLGTSASAANVTMSSGSSPANQIFRVTSSLKYKTDITTVPQMRIDAVQTLRPVEFTSTASADIGCGTRFVGLIAEEVAEIDRALAHCDDKGNADGVMYDRVLLLQVEGLRQRVEQLEQQLATRH